MLIPGSSEEQAAIARFKQFFADFSPGKIDDLLDHTYAEHLYFNDTLKTLQDRANLRHYLQDSAAATESCLVDVDDVIVNNQGDYYFRWRIRFKRFARGRDTESIGISQIRFDADSGIDPTLAYDFLRSHEALASFVPYRVERQSRNLVDDARRQQRQEKPVPILTRFKTWLGEQIHAVLPKSALGG